MNRRLHLCPSLALAIEVGQCYPLVGGMSAYRDSLFVLPLGCAKVFLRDGNAASQLVRARRIQLIQAHGDFFGLARASAQDAWSRKVELAKVGQRLNIARIQPYRFFKLRTHPFGQGICAQKTGAVGSLAQCTSQPQAIG